MNVLGWILVIVAAIAVFFMLIAVFRAGIRYFRQRWNYSVWPGFYLLLFALTAFAFANTQQLSWDIFLYIAAGGLTIGAVILDLLRTSFGMGLIALLMQMMMTAGFVLVIIAALLIMVIRSVMRRQGRSFVDTARQSGGFAQTVLRLLAG